MPPARAADEADAALARGEGEHRPLLGIPYALKDIFVTRAIDDDGRDLPGGLPTTAGSRILEGYRSPFASSAEERLREAGAVLLGKTNCDEFAMGSSNENSAYGPVRNPWDESTVPGRLVGRLVGGRRGRPGLLRARHRYRGLDPSAGVADRHGRHEADLRAGEPMGDGRLRLQPRPVRPVRDVRSRTSRTCWARWRATTRATRPASTRRCPTTPRR